MADTIKLSLEFPQSLVEGLWTDAATASTAVKEAGVLDLSRQKRISIRKGAELLGLSYRAFLALLAQHQIPIADYEVGEIDGDLEALAKRKQQVEWLNEGRR